MHSSFLYQETRNTTSTPGLNLLHLSKSLIYYVISDDTHYKELAMYTVSNVRVIH